MSPFPVFERGVASGKTLQALAQIQASYDLPPKALRLKDFNYTAYCSKLGSRHGFFTSLIRVLL